MILENYPALVQSERLAFRPLILEDAATWQRFLENPNATAHFPQHMKANNKLRGLHWVEKQLKRYRDKQGGLMAVLNKQSGEFMGQAGLIVQQVDGNTELEVGYHFFPEYWGNGYATEAAIFFKQLAFSISSVNCIVSCIEVHNIPSKQVATRNGMHPTSQTRWMDLDILIYRIDRAEIQQ